MNPLDMLSTAVRALLRNKLRSFLTALGIIVGTAAVIAMVSIGEGAKARIAEAFTAMGNDLLVLQSGSSTSGGARGGAGSQPALTWEDLRAIRSELRSVRLAAPVLRTSAPVLSGEQNWTTNVFGTSPEYFELRKWSMALGTPLNSSDVDSGVKVAVLGQTVAENLFGSNSDPIGQSVRIRNIPFEVVGVMERKGQSTTGQDYDDAVFISYKAYLSKLTPGPAKFLVGQIVLGADSNAGVDRAAEEVAGLLRQRHRIGPNAPDDFNIRNLAEIASAQAEGTETLSTLLASIAAVSLLVGGIGIMNIMLVSVTERTREIGVRMAVGARPRDILGQFLAESLVLSACGGLAGVALGWFVALRMSENFGWPLLIRGDIIAVALGVSLLVGVVFGLYPARKAARLDPIEALRYE